MRKLPPKQTELLNDLRDAMCFRDLRQMRLTCYVRTGQQSVYDC